MRYRNSECCVTPDEAINTESLGSCNIPIDWNQKDGWSSRKKYDEDKDDWYRKNKKNDVEDRNCGCENPDSNASVNIMQKLTELKFAAVDLNLYLDTHPCDEEALEMFKKITHTIKSLKADYIRKYGPLMSGDSSDEVPFQWASCKFKWPWEK